MKKTFLWLLVASLIVTVAFQLFLFRQKFYTPTDALWDIGLIAKGEPDAPFIVGTAVVPGSHPTIAAALYTKPVLGLYTVLVAWLATVLSLMFWNIATACRMCGTLYQNMKRDRDERRRQDHTVRINLPARQ